MQRVLFCTYLGCTPNRKQEEIERLKEIVIPVKMAKAIPTLMLTLITKQDLWWEGREAVKSHYQNSAYNDVIKEIVETRGTANFSHEYLSTSLIINNFKSGANELLKPVSAGYDQALQFGHLNDVFKKIDSFCQQR